MSDQPETFEQALEDVINRWSQENPSNTPDFILAQYLHNCLQVWNAAVAQREKWYGRTDARLASVPAAYEAQERERVDLLISVNAALHAAGKDFRVDVDATGQAVLVPVPECFSNVMT